VRVSLSLSLWFRLDFVVHERELKTFCSLSLLLSTLYFVPLPHKFSLLRTFSLPRNTLVYCVPNILLYYTTLLTTYHCRTLTLYYVPNTPPTHILFTTQHTLCYVPLPHGRDGLVGRARKIPLCVDTHFSFYLYITLLGLYYIILLGLFSYYWY
jgi:hypothetical protein